VQVCIPEFTKQARQYFRDNTRHVHNNIIIISVGRVGSCIVNIMGTRHIVLSEVYIGMRIMFTFGVPRTETPFGNRAGDAFLPEKH